MESSGDFFVKLNDLDKAEKSGIIDKGTNEKLKDYLISNQPEELSFLNKFFFGLTILCSFIFLAASYKSANTGIILFSGFLFSFTFNKLSVVKKDLKILSVFTGIISVILLLFSIGYGLFYYLHLPEEALITVMMILGIVLSSVQIKYLKNNIFYTPFSLYLVGFLGYLMLEPLKKQHPFHEEEVFIVITSLMFVISFLLILKEKINKEIFHWFNLCVLGLLYVSILTLQGYNIFETEVNLLLGLIYLFLGFFLNIRYILVFGVLGIMSFIGITLFEEFNDSLASFILLIISASLLPLTHKLKKIEKGFQNKVKIEKIRKRFY